MTIQIYKPFIDECVKTGSANGKKHCRTVKVKGQSFQVCDRFYDPKNKIDDYSFICPCLDSKEVVRATVGTGDPNLLSGHNMQNFYCCNRGKQEEK